MNDSTGLGYYGSFEDTHFGEMQKMEKASINKRLEPANPAVFINTVSEIIREHNDTHAKLVGRYKEILGENNRITAGLKRLDGVVNSAQKITLTDLRETYRELVNQASGIDATLARCKRILDDVTTTSQLIGETFKSDLADKRKKAAMQQELSLRLEDIGDQYKRCEKAVDDYGSAQTSLKNKIAELTTKMNIHLPPEVKKNLDHKQAIEELVMQKQQEFRKNGNGHSGARVVTNREPAKPASAPAPKPVAKPQKKFSSLIPGGARVLGEEDPGFFSTWSGRVSILVIGVLLGSIAAAARGK